MPDSTHLPHNDAVMVERRDAPLGLIATLAAGVAAFLVLTSVGLMLVYPSARYGSSDAPRGTTAMPRLQLDPAADLAAQRMAEARTLAGYGWIDKAHGIVRIPIDQAMRDVAAAGIKDWPR